jgi:branched-chain amino acid transport system substrate-binding protein
MTTRRVGAMIAVLVALAAFAVSASATTRKAPGKPITIGAAVALSGFWTAYDSPQNAMMEFGLADFNRAGGVLGRPLKLIYANTYSDPNRAGQAAIAVMSRGADIVVTTPDYDMGHGAAAEAQSRGKLAVGAAGSPKYGLQGIGDLVFNVGISSNAEGASMAEYAYQTLAFRRPYVLLDDTIDYDRQTCKHFKTRWTELAGAGSIAGEDIFKNADPSIATQLSRVKSASPAADFVVICSYNPGAASAIRQLRASGIQTPIVASASMDGDYWLKAVPNLNDFYYVAYASLFGDDPNPKVNELVRRYKARTGKSPTQSTCLVGYSQIEVIAKGVAMARSTDGAKVAAALERLRNFPTVLGPLTYTDKLHFTNRRPLRVMKIVDGKQSFVRLWNPAKVPPVDFSS